MPLTSTVRPPLTLPLVVPVTNSPDSSAFSSAIHDARRLALSRDRMVSPYPFSMAAMSTKTKSPTCTSVSPLSFLNSSTGTYASDLRPALTTTKLCSMRTTSAVITSPARISERCSDSSNRAAKDSDIQVPCTSLRFPAAPLPLFLGLGRRFQVRLAPRFVDDPRGQCACCAMGAVRACAASPPCWHGFLTASRADGSERLLLLPPGQHPGHRVVDRLLRVVQQEGILRRLQRCDGPLRIAGVARFQVGAKNVDCNGNPLRTQLLVAPLRPARRTGSEEHLEGGI